MFVITIILVIELYRQMQIILPESLTMFAKQFAELNRNRERKKKLVLDFVYPIT